MNFTPKTEKEIAEMNLIPAGEYDFEIIEANDKVSKSGNDMIELKLKVFDHNGAERVMFDYLLEQLAFKLRHAAEACNLVDRYNMGTLVANDFVNKSGRLKLGIQKDKTGAYPDKNTVADYITPKMVETMTAHAAQPAAEMLSDSIPF